MPAGRPTKYKEEYCKTLIETMTGGLSYEAAAAVIGVNTSTLYEWEKKHPEFSNAKREAFGQSRLFWEKAGIGGMYMGGKDNPFNSTVWVFNMKNRFGWKDNTNHTIAADIKTTIKVDHAKEILKIAEED